MIELRKARIAFWLQHRYNIALYCEPDQFQSVRALIADAAAYAGVSEYNVVVKGESLGKAPNVRLSDLQECEDFSVDFWDQFHVHAEVPCNKKPEMVERFNALSICPGITPADVMPVMNAWRAGVDHAVLPYLSDTRLALAVQVFLDGGDIYDSLPVASGVTKLKKLLIERGLWEPDAS
jgi:hypothetical protein